MENIEEQEQQRVIAYNVDLLQWYFTKNKHIISDQEKDRLFSIMSYAMMEDTHCFMRVLLYIANTRVRDEEEIAYKILLHFLGVMSPEIVMANIDMLLTFGRKDDILYLLQCTNITDRILTFLKHKAKEDPDFATLMEGTQIKKPSKRVAYYRPKFNKDNTWSVFLTKLLDDPKFNGISLPKL